MTIILTKDCLGIIANHLYIKDAIKIALLNKEYNEIWPYIKYEHVVKYQNLDVIKRNKNIKFSYRSKKLFDIPENLSVLYLSYTNISDISGFDVKNLVNLILSYTISNISGFDVKNLEVNLIYRFHIISNISGFDVKNLHVLNLSYTRISDISGFDVKNLSVLDLSFTKISNISGFDVKNLRSLILYETIF